MSIKYKWLLGALLALLLAACGGEVDQEQSQAEKGTDDVENEQYNEEDNDHNDYAHIEEQETRFIASSATGIHVYNEQFDEVKSFDYSNASLSQIANSPYVFVKDKEQNSGYQFLHVGVWTDAQANSYAEEAMVFEQSIKGSNPAHVVSFNEQIAIFNDGDGSVQVYKLEDISNGSAPTLLYEYKGLAHHGVAIPLENEMLAVSYPAKEGDALPTGVKIVNEKGEEQSVITSACEQLHGAAHVDNTLAFGCVGSVVLYDLNTKGTKEIELKDGGSRVGTFKFATGSDYLLTNYSVGENATTEVGVINRHTGEMGYVTLPAAYKSALLATKEKGYVLAEDGNLYEVDFATKSISAFIEAINPFDLNEEAPALHEVNGQIYIVVPNHELVYVIHGDHAHVAELPFAITSFIVK